MSNSLKISSVIIAKNEERNILNCLESQKDCIDEVIVLVDKKSTDKTLQIVSSFTGIKYEEVEWMGYSATKQHAVNLSTNDWILWIDADEAITDQLAEEIKKFKLSEPRFSAYSVPRRAYFLGRWIKHSGWYPGRVTRLFDKTRVNFSDSNVHEHLIVNGEIGKLKHDLDHFTDPTIKHYFEKFNKYTSLAADELYRKKKKAGLSDILLRPPLIFFKMYIVKLGFLDGLHGFILAAFSSAYVFTKYCKLWEKQVKKT